MKARNYCFTLFLPTFSDTYLPLPPVCFPEAEFEAGQYEKCPTTGKIHWQGVVFFPGPLSFSTVKNKFPEGSPHVEETKGTKLQAYEYVCKYDAWHDTLHIPYTYQRGKAPELKLKGKTTQSAALIQRIRDGADVSTLADQFPAQVVRSLGNVRELISLIGPKHTFKAPDNLRDWQRKLIMHLCYKAEDRKILWFYDPQGGAGKSTVVRYGISAMNAITLNGRIQDMAHAYNGQPIVFFDVSRTQADTMDHLYSFAETLKNGVIFSTKYNSGQKTFDPPHVVFMSNSLPDTSKWTSDRLVLTQLSNPTTFHSQLEFVPDFTHPIATAGGLLNEQEFDKWA